MIPAFLCFGALSAVVTLLLMAAVAGARRNGASELIPDQGDFEPAPAASSPAPLQLARAGK